MNKCTKYGLSLFFLSFPSFLPSCLPSHLPPAFFFSFCLFTLLSFSLSSPLLSSFLTLFLPLSWPQVLVCEVQKIQLQCTPDVKSTLYWAPFAWVGSCRPAPQNGSGSAKPRWVTVLWEKLGDPMNRLSVRSHLQQGGSAGGCRKQLGDPNIRYRENTCLCIWRHKLHLVNTLIASISHSLGALTMRRLSHPIWQSQLTPHAAAGPGGARLAAAEGLHGCTRPGCQQLQSNSPAKCNTAVETQ